MIRLVIAEDQVLLRQGLVRLLNQQPDLQVVADVGDGRAAVATVEALQPDLVLMDLRMPEMDGVAATQEICDLLPNTKVVILTTFDDDESVTAALQAGAIGYLLKDTPAEDLAQAIRAAHKGYAQLAPGLMTKVMAPSPAPTSTSAPTASQAQQLAKLTPREREVLSLIATGANNQEIAEILSISRKTVKNHVSNILGRLDMRDRTQAALFASSFLSPQFSASDAVTE